MNRSTDGWSIGPDADATFTINPNPRVQGLAELSRLLQAVHSPPPPCAAEQEQQQQFQQQVGRCNYDAFCQLKAKAPPAARAYFTVENFLKVCQWECALVCVEGAVCLSD